MLLSPYFAQLDPEGTVVGCGGYAVRGRPRVADLCWGMVRRDRHGEGFGRALASLRIQRIPEDPGVSEIALNTSQRTVAFYEWFGFHAIRVEPDGCAPGLDRVQMRLGRARAFRGTGPAHN